MDVKEVRTMKNRVWIITLMALLYAGSAFAANGTEGGGIGLIGWVFIGFVAAVVAFQLIPSLILFGSMLVAIFGKAKNHKRVTDNGKSGVS